MRGLGSQLPEDFRKCGFGNTEGIQSDQLIARENACARGGEAGSHAADRGESVRRGESETEPVPYKVKRQLS